MLLVTGISCGRRRQHPQGTAQSPDCRPWQLHAGRSSPACDGKGSSMIKFLTTLAVPVCAVQVRTRIDEEESHYLQTSCTSCHVQGYVPAAEGGGYRVNTTALKERCPHKNKKWSAPDGLVHGCACTHQELHCLQMTAANSRMQGARMLSVEHQE